MPKVSHVREEIWDEATKEFRFKTLPTTPDEELSYVGTNYSGGAEITIGSVIIPLGSVLRVTFMRYLTSDPRGAIFIVTANGGTVDTPYLPSPGETLVIQPIDNPIYVLSGTVEFRINPLFGSIYSGTLYGLVIHGYYSKQEEMKYIT